MPARPDLTRLVAHDLKSPMSTIALNLEYVLSELGDHVPLELRGALQDCMVANTRAVSLVGDMADAARLREGDAGLAEQPVDLRATLTSALAQIARDAKARGVRLTSRLSPATCSGDERLLGRAIERLVEWAARHAGFGDEMEARCSDGAIVLEVPNARLSGLRPSLAVHYAESVVRAHGGDVAVDVDLRGGLRVTVTLTP